MIIYLTKRTFETDRKIVLFFLVEVLDLCENILKLVHSKSSKDDWFYRLNSENITELYNNKLFFLQEILLYFLFELSDLIHLHKVQFNRMRAFSLDLQ